MTREEATELLENQIYELRDRGEPIYRGQTRAPLNQRLQLHKAKNKSKLSTPLGQHLKQVREEERLEDITIHPLTGYDTEKAAIADAFEQLLNTQSGSEAPPPIEIMDDLREYGDKLGEVPDCKIAKTHDVTSSAVSYRRRKLGIPPTDTKHTGRLSDAEVMEVRERHLNTEDTHADIAEDYPVTKRTISYVIRRETFDWLPHPEVSKDMKEKINTMLNNGAGPQSIGRELSISPCIVKDKFVSV
jgi:hypothetical protein